MPQIVSSYFFSCSWGILLSSQVFLTQKALNNQHTCDRYYSKDIPKMGLVLTSWRHFSFQAFFFFFKVDSIPVSTHTSLLPPGSFIFNDMGFPCFICSFSQVKNLILASAFEWEDCEPCLHASLLIRLRGTNGIVKEMMLTNVCRRVPASQMVPFWAEWQASEGVGRIGKIKFNRFFFTL